MAQQDDIDIVSELLNSFDDYRAGMTKYQSNSFQRSWNLMEQTCPCCNRAITDQDFSKYPISRWILS